MHECRWHGVGGSDLLELEYCTVILSCLMWAISLASTIHGWSCYVAQGSLELNPTALASQVLELQACMTEPRSNKLEVNFNSLFFILHFNVGKHCTSQQPWYSTSLSNMAMLSRVNVGETGDAGAMRWAQMGYNGTHNLPVWMTVSFLPHRKSHSALGQVFSPKEISCY